MLIGMNKWHSLPKETRDKMFKVYARFNKTYAKTENDLKVKEIQHILDMLSKSWV